jgi:hypothetical protein
LLDVEASSPESVGMSGRRFALCAARGRDHTQPEPVFGALPVPVLWASAGATIAATIATAVRRMTTRDSIALFLLPEQR